MTNPYKTQAYYKTHVETASKEALLLMLYEACIRFLKKSKIALENKDIAEKGKMLGKAQDIVNELNSTLDMENGGEVMDQLQALYLYVSTQSTEANIHNDPKKIDHCIKIMTTLHEGWQGAVEQLQGHSPPSSAKKLDIRSK